MTAKEIVHQLQDDGTMTEDKAVQLIQQYAKRYTLAVVSEAVDDFKADWGSANYDLILGVEELLTRIEEKTNADKNTTRRA